MKIALVRCSGSLNVGNEFINAGGEFLIRKAFPEAEIIKFEFYDSTISSNYRYPSPPLLKYEIDFINGCDLAVVFSGSIISKFTEACLFDLASAIKCKKILLGAGAYQYDAFDRELALRLKDVYDLIFTRDDVTFSFFGGAKNVHSGIDLAFYVKDSLRGSPHLRGDYGVVDIDAIADNLETIAKEKKNLQLSEGCSKVYIVENTTTRYTDIPDYLYAGYWETLYNVFANSKFVVTNRIHTSLVCVCYGIPFKYLGHDQGGEIGRNTLFMKVGLSLKSGVVYSSFGAIHASIEKEKQKLLSTIRREISNG